MASHSVQTAKHSTLTAATVDSITLAAYARYVQVINRDATNAIYGTIGRAPSDPTSGGDNTFVVQPASALVLAYPVDAGGANAVVKLFPAAGTPAYAVQLIPDRN